MFEMLKSRQRFLRRAFLLHPIILMMLVAVPLPVYAQTPYPHRADNTSAAPSASTVNVKDLSVISPAGGDNASSAAPSEVSRQPDEEASLWPVSTFLRGEAHRLRGENIEARSLYRSIAEWAATDPYGDGWGGSGLSGVALWRWLKLLVEMPDPDPKEVEAVLKLVPRLRESRLVKGMHKPSILGSLPQLEEEISRYSALLAWSSGRREDASAFFPSYLLIACKVKPGDREKEMMEQLSMSGAMAQGQLNLLHGKCAQSRGMNDKAIEFFSKAHQSEEAHVRNEAALLWAQLESKKDLSPDRVNKIAALFGSVYDNATDTEMAQKALYHRALLYNRKGPGKNMQRFQEDLLLLAENFPTGSWTDDALYRLAMYHEDQGELERALYYYERLRNFKGANDWGSLAAFKPAMALYTRADPGDISRAATILLELEERLPSGPLHLSALFWLGRIAEESGDAEKAKVYFQRVIEESPYDYYALRARMHLRSGRQAASQLWPDSEIKKELRVAYRDNGTDRSLQEVSPYHVRLRHALETGLYSLAFTENHRLRQLFPSKRLEGLSPEDLDREGLLTHISLLLALRQDVFAAKDRLPEPQNRLQLARAVGDRAGDWPLAMRLITATDEPTDVRAAAQRNPLYLSAAYPTVFEEAIGTSARRHDVRPELLYAVMRNESLFNPDALSPSNALGLFQFIPSTFEGLNKKWKVLAQSGAAGREAFLLDPHSNIGLGARWFKEELLSRNGGHIPFSVMGHNAGPGAVRRWAEKWKSLGRDGDLEYMLETVPYLETRIFARRVLTDMILADAVGIFRKEPPSEKSQP